jgi:ubiquinone/menaquinone biosynthesis C-methylase UbiE
MRGHDVRTLTSQPLARDSQSAVEVHSKQAPQFAARYGETDPYASCFSYSRARLQHWLDHGLPPKGSGARLLDLGCGTGHQMAELRGRGFEVTGVDGSAEMLDHARANNPDAEIHQADVSHLPLADGNFDYILCIEVLRYLKTPERCIAEMARVLRPGGVALATATPRFNLNGYALVNRVALALPQRKLTRLKQHFVTAHGIETMFEGAGFADAQAHGVYIGPVNWIERLAPKRLPGFLRRWEHTDSALADRPLLRELSNMLLVRAVR